MKWLRFLSVGLLAVFFIVAGINHFRDPAVYLGMMPKWLPWPDKLQLLAGAAEVAGGLGVLIPAVRRWAAWGLLLLLVAVFPANLQVALHGWPGAPFAVSPWILWARLPLQAVLMAWVWWTFLKRGGPREGRHSVDPIP
ncbi:MAG: DoxX family protein [Verrucomicrobiales bacterium]|nr:DoxX family protein [Verrucomicrobiales bacterium]